MLGALDAGCNTTLTTLAGVAGRGGIGRRPG
jgi:hypothetical protein